MCIIKILHFLSEIDGVVLDCDSFSALAMDLLQCRSIMYIFIYTQVYISQVCVVRSVLMLITKVCCFYVAYIYIYNIYRHGRFCLWTTL